MTPPSRSTEYRRLKQREYRARSIEKYLMLSPHPLCECGCGQKVRFDVNGRPNRFVIHHQKGDFTAARAAKRVDTIDIIPFREALVKLKAQKGWTIAEMAERGGVQPGHISDLLYNKRRRWVERPWARDFFARLSGKATAPSTWQMRQMLQEERVNKHLMSEDWYWDRPVPEA